MPNPYLTALPMNAAPGQNSNESTRKMITGVIPTLSRVSQMEAAFASYT